MSSFEQQLSRSDFDRCRWEEIIAMTSERDCREYSWRFLREANKARDESDSIAEAVFAVLFVVTDVELMPDDFHQPFGPRFVSQAARGVMAEDLKDQHWAIFAELAPTVADAEMRARLCDLVWVAKRNHQLGRKAVEAYLESARTLEHPDNWPPCAWRISRAVRLARSIGGAEDLFDVSIRHTETLVTKLNGEDSRFLTGILMQLLQEFKKGDPAKYGPLAEKAAERAEAEGGLGFDRACKLWLIAATWHSMAKDPVAGERTRIRSAETHVKDAEEQAARPKELAPNMQAALRMERAILAMSRIGTPAARARHDQLYPRLTEFQAKARAEMPSFDHSVDMTDTAKFAAEQVAGKTLALALHALGGLCKPAPVANLRQQALDTFRSPIHAMMGMTKLTGAGKIAARAPQFDSTPQGAEEAILAQMHWNAILHRKCIAVGIIVPAIWKIRAEHNVRLQDFYEVVATSPFVPPGRELTFAKGLYAGFTFDLIVSTHLLIPQIEQAIRVHLESRGAITSGFDKQWRQNEYDLNTTLRMAELKTVFDDEDLIFDLRGLLTEHEGSNLRNETAHGLLDDTQLGTDDAMYLWALTLRLCMFRLKEKPIRQDG